MEKIIRKHVEMAIKELFSKEGVDFELQKIEISKPKEESFGDFTINVAMILAGKLKKNPMEIAEQIKSDLSLDSEPNFDFIDKIEIVKPGYINFYLKSEYFHERVIQINQEKDKFGNQEFNGSRINNEFISANPTGPLHIGNGRGGFYGDVISNVLRKAGNQVDKEYFVNDAGEQVIKLGHSVLKDDEAVYGGEYIDELNKRLPEIKEKLGDKKDDVKEIGWKASDLIMHEIIRPLVEDEMKIEEMNYVYERDMYFSKGEEKNYVDRALDILREKNLTFEEDGALWLKTTKFGDDKDRVLVKGDGNKTYFASDCGYLLYKIERKYDKIIEIWGADHHGYVKRFEAAARALGFEGEMKFIILQLVKLVKDGKEVRMSKRAGNVVYVSDLIEEVGHDATRFIFLMYSPDTHMDFDLGLAKERSSKNPVFYVQYAHARICSILDKAWEIEASMNAVNFSLLVHEKEISLMRELDKFAKLIEEISKSYEVHKLPHYAVGLADKFHSFYAVCKVNDMENIELSKARQELINAVRIVLAETLRLIGVSAPDKM